MQLRLAPWNVALAAGALFGSSAGAWADEIYFEANFSGNEVVPPVQTNAQGTLAAVVDTERRAVTWFIDWQGLTGPATSIRIHGPAAEGENGPLLMSLSSELVSPINGGTNFSEARIGFFAEGRVYIVIGTAANPEGELRAQFVPQGVQGGDGED